MADEIVHTGLAVFLCCIAECCESCCIIDSHLGEHLAVDLDACLLEAVHELAVGDAVSSGSCVDSCDPQSSVFSLLVLASDVCGSQASHNCRVSSSESVLSSAVETLSLLQNLLMSLMSVDALLYSCHILTPPELLSH